MNAYETLLSLRAVRHFQERPIPDDALQRILQAGRWTGSAKNVQPWQFMVVRERQTLEALSGCGRYAGHLKGAAAAVVIVTQPGWGSSFDAGRCAQSMMLSAWSEGIGSCIASLHDESRVRSTLGVPEPNEVGTAISFGYPMEDAPKTIEGRPIDEVLAQMGRRPLDEIVHWERW